MKHQKSNNRRSIETVKNEIKTLRRIIEARERWLNNPENRKRSTYVAVYKDTLALSEKLEELHEELKQMVNY